LGVWVGNAPAVYPRGAPCPWQQETLSEVWDLTPGALHPWRLSLDPLSEVGPHTKIRGPMERVAGTIFRVPR
jgi:hypothetical protein